MDELFLQRMKEWKACTTDQSNGDLLSDFSPDQIEKMNLAFEAANALLEERRLVLSGLISLREELDIIGKMGQASYMTVVRERDGISRLIYQSDLPRGKKEVKEFRVRLEALNVEIREKMTYLLAHLPPILLASQLNPIKKN